MTLRLRFGAPRSNWIPLGLSSESIAFDELVSATPEDPLAGIARAALAAARGEHGSCLLHAGPEVFAMAFAPARGEVQLDVTRWRDADRTATPVRVFRKRGTPEAVLVPVWRGLRELGGRWPRTADFWRTPFPEDEVARLGGALGVG